MDNADGAGEAWGLKRKVDLRRSPMNPPGRVEGRKTVQCGRACRGLPIAAHGGYGYQVRRQAGVQQGRRAQPLADQRVRHGSG